MRYVNGRFSRVPEGFVIPNRKIRDMWVRFFFSDHNLRIPPLGEIGGDELSRKEGKKFSKYKRLMMMIIEECKRQGKWRGKPVDEASAGRLFDEMDLSGIVGERKKEQRSIKSLRWRSVSNMCKEKQEIRRPRRGRS